MKKIFLLIVLCLAAVFLIQNDLWSSETKKQRIISLAPAATEILFSLGLENQIVGVTTFCDYPPKAKDKEKIGTFSEPDIEKIITLKPDLIFATGLEQLPVVEKLKRLNLIVYLSDPSNMEELFASIKEIGELTSKEKEAGSLISRMKDKIQEIEAKVKFIPQDKRKKVFIQIWHDPLMTAGNGSFVDELIKLAGGINIAFDSPRAYSYFSPEQVIKRNPDCIILGQMGQAINTVKNRFGWDKITAVQKNAIYDDIDPNLFFRPGPRLTEGLEEFYKRLYQR